MHVNVKDEDRRGQKQIFIDGNSFGQWTFKDSFLYDVAVCYSNFPADRGETFQYGFFPEQLRMWGNIIILLFTQQKLSLTVEKKYGTF